MPSAPPIIDSDLLCAFAAFAETRNFTRAARLLGLSQPACFERVQRLQEGLGVPLYRRVGRALELTEHGARLAAHARESQERDHAFLRALRGESTPAAVTLAAGEGSYLYLLGPALRRFTEAGVGRLRLLTLGANAACGALLCGEAHLAVCALDLVPAELRSEDLVSTPLCAVMHREHRLAQKQRIALRDVRGERLILAPAGQLHRDLIVRALSAAGCDVVDPIEADGWPLMLRFASLGLGLAFINGVCALPEDAVSRPVPELGQVRYRLLRRRDAHLPPEAEALAQMIRGPSSISQS